METSKVNNVNANTIRLSEIKVPASLKQVTKKAKDLSVNLKGCMIMYRESITPLPAIKGDEKINEYNKSVREQRSQLGVDATAFLLNTRVAVRYMAKVLPNVDGVFVNEYTVYSESINKEGKVVVTDTRGDAIKLGVAILYNDGKEALRNCIEEPVVDKNGLKKIKGWKPVKKYTLDYVCRFVEYAVNMWIANGRPSK